MRQVGGFGLRITEHSQPGDIGAFVVVGRFPGSPHPAPRKIGNYPAMTLSKAREIAREWLEDIRQGIDPKVKAERRGGDAGAEAERRNSF